MHDLRLDAFPPFTVRYPLLHLRLDICVVQRLTGRCECSTQSVLAVNYDYRSKIGKKSVPRKTKELVAIYRPINLLYKLVTTSDLLPEVNNVRFFEQYT